MLIIDVSEVSEARARAVLKQKGKQLLCMDCVYANNWKYEPTDVLFTENEFQDQGEAQCDECGKDLSERTK